MKSPAIGLLLAVGLAAALGSARVTTQPGADTVEAHVAAAKAAAGQEHTALFGLCDAPAPAPAPRANQSPAAQRKGPPERSQWHAEPVKVFDNLYFVGQTEYFGVGGHHIGRDYRHRYDLRLLGRGRDCRRTDEARAGSEHDQVRPS